MCYIYTMPSKKRKTRKYTKVKGKSAASTASAKTPMTAARRMLGKKPPLGRKITVRPVSGQGRVTTARVVSGIGGRRKVIKLKSRIIHDPRKRRR